MLVVFTKLLLPKNGGLQRPLEDVLSEISDKVDTENVEIIRYRGEDIPQLVDSYVSKGIATYGITGVDLWQEYWLLKKGSTSICTAKRIEWVDENAKFGKPVLAFILPEEVPLENYLKPDLNVAINRKYFNISTAYLAGIERESGITIKINEYNGNTEQTVFDGLNDACIEIVYSGKTLDEKQLRIVDIVMRSDLVLLSPRLESFS